MISRRRSALSSAVNYVANTAFSNAYVKRNGTTPLTGAWDAGSFRIRAETFQSDVASGTAPLVVASTSLVSNLNADMLDGKHAYEFASASGDYVKRDGTAPLTANWDAGTFKITANQLESDVATGTAPLVIASTTLCTNLNADMVDGLHASATNTQVVYNDGGTLAGDSGLTFTKASDTLYVAGNLGVGIAPTAKLHVSLASPGSGTVYVARVACAPSTRSDELTGIRSTIEATWTGDQAKLTGIEAICYQTNTITGTGTSVDEAAGLSLTTVSYSTINAGYDHYIYGVKSTLTNWSTHSLSGNSVSYSYGWYSSITSKEVIDVGVGNTGNVWAVGLHLDMSAEITESTGTAIYHGYGILITGEQDAGLDPETAQDTCAIKVNYDGKWAYYNEGSHNFLGGDDVKQYLGDGPSACIYWDGSNLVVDPTNGGTPGAYSLDVPSSIKSKGRLKAVATKTSTYGAGAADEVIICNKGSAMEVTLPAATGSGRVYEVKNINSGVVTLNPNSTETIDGATTLDLAQWESARIVDYGTGVWVLSGVVEKNIDADTVDGHHASEFLSGGTYVSVDGTSALTADWDAGSYEIRAQTFESDVTTGTAPLVVASTTVCTNLNADLIDGHHASEFLSATGYVAADGTTPLTADWDAGAFEVRAQTFESDVTTGTAPLVIASTTVCTNLNADLLDGHHAAEFLYASGYVAADGTTALTANWDAGAFEIRAETFESDVTTGTAPMTVASTTVVTNLNADTVDGKHSSDFLTKDGATTLTADWDAGSYEVRAQTFESDVATGTAPLVIASTTLVSNLNADLLDGQHASDFLSGAGYVKTDGTSALTADWDAGSYEIRARTFESDVATGTAPLVIASTTLVTNLNADMLDGYHASEFQMSASDHELLSSRHSDTLTGTVARGDLLVGNSTPKWSRKAKGSAGQLVTFDANDVVYTTATYPATTTSGQILHSTAANTVGGSTGLTFGAGKMYVNAALGVGSTSPQRQLEVNSTAGQCLRLTYNDSLGSSANYADALVSSSGQLTVTASGGDVRIGNAAATHCTNFDETGHQTMVGDARPWRDELGDLVGKKRVGTRVTEDLAEGTVVFSDSCQVATDYVIMNVQLNHDRDPTSVVHPHLHWFQTSANVPNWLLQYRWQRNGAAKATSWTSMRCNNVAVTYVSGTIMQISYSDTVPAPPDSGLSDIIQFRLSRDTDNDSTLFAGADPLAGDAHAISFDIHIQLASLGSSEEYAAFPEPPVEDYPVGTAPASMPTGVGGLSVGLFENTGATWMLESGIPWDLRYRYVTHGWMDNWGYGPSGGEWVAGVLSECKTQGFMPALTYYDLLGQPGGGEGQTLEKCQNTTTMASYFADFKTLMTWCAAFGDPVFVHVEPDAFGFLESQCGGDPSTTCAVASTGLTDLASLPNTAAGWGMAFLKLRDAANAENVILGIHVSGWATDHDLFHGSDTSLELQPHVDEAYDFLSPMGLVPNITGAEWDVLVGDPLDRDANYYLLARVPSENRWWDTNDSAGVNTQSFVRYRTWLHLWNVKAEKRWVLWQIPIGNSNHLDAANVGQARGGWRDNRTEYFFGASGATHRAAFQEAGVISLLFGRGEGTQSTYSNDYDAEGNLYLKAGAGQFYGSTPPWTTPKKIMPLGDSTTIGVNGGYRNQLYASLAAAGWTLDFVGSYYDSSTRISDKECEGHSGYSTLNLKSNIDAWLAAYTPDVVLLWSGINDYGWWNTKDSDEMAADYFTLVDQIRADLPSVWIVCGTTPPITSAVIETIDKDRAVLRSEYNQYIRDEIAARLVADPTERIKLADIASNCVPTLTTADCYDGVHPTEEAHNRIAVVWSDVLQTLTF